jgi:hypothetical protein
MSDREGEALALDLIVKEGSVDGMLLGSAVREGTEDGLALGLTL